MSSKEIAIRVQNVGKCYQIYETPRDRLKQFVLPRLQRFVRKKPRQYYKEFWALNDLTFNVIRGETIGIIGRNGSGKSTLMQIISGTLSPTVGSVETNGRIAALLELGSGFNPEFTGIENVYMNASLLGLSKEETDARFDDILDFADIGDFIKRPVKTYSSGMMVRLAFAVAISVDPQILIIDEALSVGDELFQRKCFSRIETIKKSGATILFVSHSGATIVELCDKAILLDAGEMLTMGVPKKIVGQYQKLLYAPEDKRYAIREEIRGGNTLRYNSDVINGGKSIKNKSEGNQTDDESGGFFDPHLKPQSTLEYESRGARILSPEILTLSGKKVNCIKNGRRYRYLYEVRFDKSATNVRFGMLIKTTSGMELGGSVSSPGPNKGIPYIAKGTTVKVEFCFSCNLNPGTYFLNAGVTGSTEGDDTFLHRVLDVCMFKVLPMVNNTSTGVVDFNCVPEVVVV